MLELLSIGLVLGLKDKKIDLGELNESALEDEDSELPPFGEVVKTDSDSEDIPPFMSEMDDGDAPPFGDSPPEQSFEPSPSVSQEAISQVEERISEVSDAVAKIENLVSGFDERISKIESSMEGLLSVYELVTNEINPFIGYQNGADTGNGNDHEKDREKKAVVSATSGGQMLKERVVERGVIEIKPSDEVVKLTQINNDPNSLLLLFKWLDFLIKKVGYQGMIKTLLFYEEVGWLTREVRDHILKYSRDLSGTKASRGKRKLTTLDHIISLFFIIKLQGMDVSPTIYSEVIGQLDESELVG
ncbi:FlaD/FlaE family flagellar protein [Candidatus Pyrohabitans sp.]